MPGSPDRSAASEARVPKFGPYDIEALIGKGGMAEVYRATATEGKYVGRRVALKRLMPELAKDPAYVDQFTAESDLTRMLHHPNVIEVLDAGAQGPTRMRLGLRNRQSAGGGRDLVVGPGVTALHLEQRAVERNAGAAGDASERIDTITTGGAERRR